VRARALRSVTAGLAVLGLAACGGLGEEERRTGVDLGWRTTVDAADQAVDRLPDLFPTLEFVPFQDPVLPAAETRWSDCSSASAADAISPDEIQWTSRRGVRVEPAQETATLVDELATALAADGWEADEPEGADDAHRVWLRRDGITLSLLADTVIQADGTATIRVLAYSPCLFAPERMIDWTPPTDAPTG
jgi:hypothetical protein